MPSIRSCLFNETVNADFVWTELIGQQDEVFQAVPRSDVLLEQSGVFVINREPSGKVEAGSAARIGLAKEHQQVAFRIKHLHHRGRGIHDVSTTLMIHTYPFGKRELARGDAL